MSSFISKCISLSLFITLVTSCGGGGGSDSPVEVVDQGRFGDGNDTVTPSDPTNSDVSLSGSTVSISKSTAILNEEIVVALAAKDADGTAIPEGGLTVTFSLVGDGSSSGSFSATTDVGNGVYRATFTADTVGSANSIEAQIGGSAVTSTLPTVTVGGGNYYRDISLDTATDQDEYQLELNLTTSNFDYTNVDASGDDIRFYDSSYNELPYYLETWNTSGDSTIIVKLQDTGTNTFRMYYNNTSLAAASSKEDVYTYTTAAKTVYYDLRTSTSQETLNVSSYIANNDVTVTDSGGTTTSTISTAVPTTFANELTGPITVDGPIAARPDTNGDGADSIVPISFASTVTGYVMSRATNDNWALYNPNTSTANVTITSFDSSGANVGSTSFTINSDTVDKRTFGVSEFGLIESDIPIVGHYSNNNSTDGTILSAASTDILGACSASAQIGITEDGTAGLIYKDDGTTQTFTGDKGETVSLSGCGTQNSGEAVYVTANKPVLGAQQGDSDGSDTTVYLPISELDSDYIIPTRSQYITIFCIEAVNITLTNPTGADDSGTCTPILNFPGRLDFGSNSAVTYDEGVQITGDANFFLYYEYEDQDETLSTSWKHARAYMETEPTETIGTETDFD